jgi:hypothetical protein
LCYYALAILIGIVIALVDASFFDHDVRPALFEHIPGLETIPTTIARRYLNTLWSKYQQASKANHAG